MKNSPRAGVCEVYIIPNPWIADSKPVIIALALNKHECR